MEKHKWQRRSQLGPAVLGVGAVNRLDANLAVDFHERDILLDCRRRAETRPLDDRTRSYDFLALLNFGPDPYGVDVCGELLEDFLIG